MTDDTVVIDELASAVRAAEGAGDFLSAYERARQALDRFPDSEPLRYLAVRAMARAGSPLHAETLYREFGLARSANVDVAALEARIAKDQFLLTPWDRSLAERSANIYLRVYERTARAFPAINAATMRLLAGDPAAAQALARRVLEICRMEAPESAEDRYWHFATIAEAALLLDDVARADRALAEAATIGGADFDATRRFDATATTVRQLRLICDARGLDPGLLDRLKRPAVVFYAGHMIAPAGGSGRFAAESEAAVAVRIAAALDRLGCGFGYGALASGADILIAEALLARAAEMHVVLPFAVDEFKQVSVAPAGPTWLDRFDACLARAASVTFATEGAWLRDDVLFGYAAKIAMGLARIRARGLATGLGMLAVWDGMPAAGGAGTAVDLAYWRHQGLPVEVVDCGPPADAGGDTAGSPVVESPAGRAILPVLFADVKGFSGLQEQHLPVFNRHVMGALGAAIARFGDKVLFTNTWGDAVHAVFADIVTAARCALDMQETLRGLDFAALGLPGEVGMRVSLHVGPVFVGWDPVNREETYFGRTLTRAARMEPVTPVGEVFVTEAFAALIEMERGDRVRCTYVGIVPLAKDFGELRMYRLMRLPRPDVAAQA